MKRAALGIVLSLLLSLARTGSAEAADKWVSVRSENFLLVGNGGESQVRRVARDLEEFRATFAMLFPAVAKKSSIGTTVVVFKDDDSFKPYKTLYEGKPANVAGYFQSGSDVNFIALDANDPRGSGVIYHEYVHQLTRDVTQRLPSWVSEGLAEFYSTAENTGKSVSLGKLIGYHIQLLQQKELIPMETFLSVDQKSTYYNEKSKQGIFYAQSWALVHYLIAGNQGKRRGQLSKYLTLLADGKPLQESFEAAFETNYAGLENELRDYMRGQLAWPYFRVQLPEKIDVEKNMQSSVLSESQGEYYLGDLMLHIRRYDTAEAQLQKAIALDPAFGGSYASLGMLRFNQNKDEDARQLLAKAVETDTHNHLAHFYYAELLQRLASGDDEKTRKEHLELMRKQLKLAIEIDPVFVEAYRWLGYVALSLHDELPQTETALAQALKFAPGNEDLRLTFAEVIADNKKEAAARVVLTGLRDSTTDEVIRNRASTLIDNINARLQSAAVMRDYENRREAAGFVDRSVDAGPPKIAHPTTTASEPGSQVTIVSTPETPKGPQVEGFLTSIDCSKGMSLTVRVDNKIVQLHTDTPGDIEFVSFVARFKDSIACGPVQPEAHVVITYKPGTDPNVLGEPLVVQFLQ